MSSSEKAAYLRNKLLESRRLSSKPSTPKAVSNEAHERAETPSMVSLTGDVPDKDRPVDPEANTSALDIDGLLAEGRAAAEASVALKGNVNGMTSGDTFTKRSNPRSINESRLSQKKEWSNIEQKLEEKHLKSPLHQSTQAYSPEQGEIMEEEEDMSNNNLSVQKPHANQRISAGKMKAETYMKPDPALDGPKPPELSNKENKDSSDYPPSPQISHENSRPVSPRPTVQSEHKPAALLGFFAHYFDDVADWLEVTGYHDQSYRRRVLQRYKAFRASEEDALRTNESDHHLLRTTTFAMPRPQIRDQPAMGGTKRAYSPDSRGIYDGVPSKSKHLKVEQSGRSGLSLADRISDQRSSSADAARAHEPPPQSASYYPNNTRYFTHDPSPHRQQYSPRRTSFYSVDNREQRYVDSRNSPRYDYGGVGGDRAMQEPYDRRHTDADIKFNKPNYGGGSSYYPAPYPRDYYQDDHDAEHSDYGHANSWGYQYHGNGQGRGKGKGKGHNQHSTRGGANGGGGGSGSNTAGGGRGRGRGKGASNAATVAGAISET